MNAIPASCGGNTLIACMDAASRRFDRGDIGLVCGHVTHLLNQNVSRCQLPERAGLSLPERRPALTHGCPPRRPLRTCRVLRDPPPLFADTPPERVERYVAHLRSLTIEQRWRMLGRLAEDARTLARMGLRARHAAASDREIESRLAAMLYGREAVSLLGTVPADAVVPAGPLELPR